MRKPQGLLLIIVGTVAVVFLMLIWNPEEEAVEARIVTVRRGDVHQVVAITGRIAYTDETIAFAKADGIVARIYASPDDRISAGEALLRLDVPVQEAIVSAYAGQADKLNNIEEFRNFGPETTMENTVVRVEQDCTVRQLFVEESSVVTANTPLARLSSNQQMIVCSVSSADIGNVQPEMWAWLHEEGKEIGFARVESVGEVTADPLTGLTSAQVTLFPEQHINLPENAAVDVEIYLAGSDDVLTLPVEAVTERDTVWWVNDGRCTEIPAKIVLTDEMSAWVSLPEGICIAVGEFEEGQRVTEASE